MDPILFQGAAAALDAIGLWGDRIEAAILAAGAVFVRISAILWFLPGFGERVIPARVKLAGALAFAAVCWPAVLAGAPTVEPTLAGVGLVYAAEAVTGLLLGLMTRVLVFALQTAGMIAAQSFSISQMFGSGIAPDPEPTIATLLTLGGVTLAMALDLHIKAAALIIGSYQTLPLGAFPLASDATALTVDRIAEAFAFAISLALPFLILSFVYNLALGLINKAMPQMMVAFVGMPFITWAGLMVLMGTAAGMLTLWSDRLDVILAAPLG